MAVYKRINSLLATTATILFIFIARLIRNENRLDRDIALLDFQHPPPCTDSLREAIRLNELLAYTQYSCSSKLRAPDESHSFYLCLDLETEFNVKKTDFVFVTISNSFDDFEFETELIRLFNATGYVFTPKKQRNKHSESSQIKDRIIYYNGVVVPSDSSDAKEDSVKYVTAKNLHNTFGLLKRIDVLKLDCTNCWRLADSPKLLLDLIDENLLDNVKQLHLVVRLEEKSDDLLYAWYSTLHALYYKAKFAVYSAVQLGECGRTIIHCQYKLSFIKIPTGGRLKVLAPITGMEEVDRLLTYINTCNVSLCVNFEVMKIGSNTWKYCSLPSTTEMRLIYLFTYNTKSTNFEFQETNYRLFLFDPTLTHEECARLSSSGNVQAKSLTLADTKAGNSAPGINGSKHDWNLTVLHKVIGKLNHNQREIDILIVNLNGGEWDLFEQILSQNISKTFRQILIRCRIFYGEENENYRQLYSWFLRLEDAGWKLFYSSPYTTTNGYSCPNSSCYELGWMR